MMAAAWGAGDADSGLTGTFRCAGDLLGRVRRGIGAMSGGRAWERGSGGRKGPGHWGGGFGGPWGGWWPGPPGPPPGRARGPKAGRGDVRAAVLALLRDGPRTGYQLMSEIEERSGGAWRPSPGAVYPARQRAHSLARRTSERQRRRRAAGCALLAPAVQDWPYQHV